MRLVASLKAGHVAPSVMLRKLAAYERQNQVDIALQEIGKIERTLFMLDWLETRRSAAAARPGSTRANSVLLSSRPFTPSAKGASSIVAMKPNSIGRRD